MASRKLAFKDGTKGEFLLVQSEDTSGGAIHTEQERGVSPSSIFAAQNAFSRNDNSFVLKEERFQNNGLMICGSGEWKLE